MSNRKPKDIGKKLLESPIVQEVLFDLVLNLLKCVNSSLQTDKYVRVEPDPLTKEDK